MFKKSNKRLKRVWIFFIILSAPVFLFVIPLTLLKVYYSESRLFLIQVPLIIQTNEDCVETNMDYVLSKGPYLCSIIVDIGDSDIKDIPPQSLIINVELYDSNGDLLNTKETTVSIDQDLMEQYIQDYSDLGEMFKRTGDHVLPSPWTYMENEEGRKMRFPVEYISFENDRSVGKIKVRICSDSKSLPSTIDYYLRLERFIDAV